MALDHLQALADYIKEENVSHISVPFFFFKHRTMMKSTLWPDSQVWGDTFHPTGLYFMNFVLRSVQKWQFSLGPGSD